MPPSPTPKIFSSPAAGVILLPWLYWLSTFLLAAAFVSAFVGVGIKSDSNWPEALLLLVATFSTLAALARQLPVQNVLLAAFIIALIGSALHVLGVKSGIPFGPFIFGPEIGERLFNMLPWATPLLWIVVVLNSRGVARLVLRPWRKMRTYGFWLIGMTALFTMLFDCALEPFAAHVKHYWIWTTTGYLLTPQGVPISNSIAWFMVTVLMLAFVTPALINKQLSKRSAPDFHPLAIWLGSILLFSISAATNGLWPAVIVNGIIVVLIAIFAIRGARW
ncbi:MAG: carotenoid biosynthesis protein [Limisphaerales bacterium]